MASRSPIRTTTGGGEPSVDSKVTPGAPRLAAAKQVSPSSWEPQELAGQQIDGSRFDYDLSRLRTHAAEIPSDGVPRLAKDFAAVARTGSGRPLPTTLAAELAMATGHSVANVRIHDDEAAGEAARRLAAAAFSHGSDIFFAPGAYDPASWAGRRVIAHEVLHTLQPQAADAVTDVSRSTDAVEREADDFALDFGRREDLLSSGRSSARRRKPKAGSRRTRLVRYPGVVPEALNEDKVRLIDPKDASSGKVWQPERGYIKNPTATKLSTIVVQGKDGSSKIGGGFDNGKYMYVVDEKGELWVGKRLQKNMPHPTLLGGIDPKVRAAGMVEIQGGKIVRIDNESGHFRPPRDALARSVKSFITLPKNVFKNLSVESVHFDVKGTETRQPFKSLRMLKLKSFNPGRSIKRMRMRYKHDPRFRGKVNSGLKSTGKAGLAILASIIAEYFLSKWLAQIEETLIRKDIEKLAPRVEAALQKSLEDQADTLDALYARNPEAEVYFNLRYRIIHVEMRSVDGPSTNSYAGLDLIWAEIAQTPIEEGVKSGGSSYCVGSTQRYQDLSMSEAVKVSDFYDVDVDAAGADDDDAQGGKAATGGAAGGKTEKPEGPP